MSAYQKLQPTSARDIIPSDTTNIPAPVVARIEGNAVAAKWTKSALTSV